MLTYGYYGRDLELHPQLNEDGSATAPAPFQQSP